MDDDAWEAAVRAAELEKIARQQTISATVAQAMADGTEDVLELLQIALDSRGGADGWAGLSPDERHLVLSTWVTVRGAIAKARRQRSHE
jgi:hypothetical protein